MSLIWNKKTLIAILSILVIVDLLAINLKIFGKKQESQNIENSSQEGVLIKEEYVSSPEVKLIQQLDCPTSCLRKIEQATASCAIAVTSTPGAANLTVKEFYIPLGQATIKNTSWVDAFGSEAVIDESNFPNPKSIIFEASLRVPSANGRVYAKLYDVTNKHDVWFSEVSSEGSASYRAESKEITLSPGRNLYRVMMKTSMDYEGVLNWARIKIILK